jgi:hypothetical protein
MLLLTTLCAASLVQDPPAPPSKQEPVAEKRGLMEKLDGASAGYTLYAPLRSHSTFLIDADGKVVHEWKADAPPGQSVYLLPSGNLLRCERVPSDVFEGGGQGGRVREYDWDSKVVWEYVCADEKRLQHHDVEPLPNGNVLLIAWEHKTAEEALAVGRSPQLLQAKQLWPDMVLEIEPARPSGGKIVWEWHAWDHLIQDRDPKLPNYGDVAQNPQRIDVNISTRAPEPTKAELEEMEKLRKLGYAGDEPDRRGDDRGGPGRGADWFHCNSIDYSPELDMIVLSSRELSELWFIDHSTTTEQAKGSIGGRYGHGGDLLFRWGNPKWHKGAGERALFGQHDAQWIPPGYRGAGNVLVFNNGERELRAFSSADELSMPFSTGTLADAFAAEGGVKVELVASYRSPDFCGHISGAQRLKNGNTLICAGETGRVVEMTPEHAIVWNYLNPHGGDVPGRDGRGGPPPGVGDGRGERRGPPGGGDGPPGGGNRGRGGPGDARGLFRATHIDADFAGLARLKP